MKIINKINRSINKNISKEVFDVRNHPPSITLDSSPAADRQKENIQSGT